MVRIARVVAALALLGSGVLMYAGSWQRWRSACPRGATGSDECFRMQAHEYDFWLPSGSPWYPVGNAAELAGLSMLLLAVAVALLPWALAGRLPGPLSLVATVAASASVALLGLQCLWSGLAGHVVEVPLGTPAAYGWGLVLPVLVGRLVAAASSWPARCAGVALVLALPFPGIFLYWLGPYDSMPWYEGIAGFFTAAAGLFLLVAALESSHGHRARRRGHHPEQAGAAGSVAADPSVVAGG